MKLKEKTFTGTKNAAVTAVETAHRKVARVAATEGFVLLKNEKQVLPIATDKKIALFGSGAVETIKGGTGSGDVNARETVSIYEGLLNAGYTITTTEWVEEYKKIYAQARIDWRDEIWEKAGTDDGGVGFFDAYCSCQFAIPAGNIPEKKAAPAEETAFFILARIAGEGADRYAKPGDYYLTEEEEALLQRICENYKHVIVGINTGGLVDLSFLDAYDNIDGLIQIMQPGMEGGNAFADIVSGAVTPSGKMTDTWAYKYEDYPNYANYSHNNGDVYKERYEEGIYVGYRYFDSYEIPVRYTFGYGISYTNFEIKTIGIEHFNLGTAHPEIGVKVQVTNTGSTYSGKEVVQIYASCPQKKMPKEYRRLVAFEKTKELAPNEMQELVIRFDVYELASYCEKTPGWVLEEGRYGIFVGNSLADAKLAAAVDFTCDVLMVKTVNVCPLQEELKEFANPQDQIAPRRSKIEAAEVLSVILHEGDILTEEAVYGTEESKIPQDVKDFVDTLTTEQLIQLATGDPGKGQGSNLGSAGISVPGSAAETSGCAYEQNLGSIVLADGPAGLRLNKKYQVENGQIVPLPFLESLENGFLNLKKTEDTGESYYQYCTAIPVGTMLAQTWNRELVEKVGEMIAEELQQFNVTLWLAPGLCIHRNPLCGRNFEYYAEDPLVSGIMAAAMTEGVQKDSGCGTTIKHFACNNQEDNRMGSDSILSERTLREIYVKGFEIAIKKAQPLSIMTSYNLVNGVHAANNYDLCTKLARDEWDFKGVIMTDWTTTEKGEDCTATGCMLAGNDLVMPGVFGDHENMRKSLEDGTLKVEDLKKRIAHLVETVWKSNCYEK